MKIDDKNNFSYSENEEFEDLSEFDIKEEVEEVAPAVEVVREVAAHEEPVYEETQESVEEYEEQPEEEYEEVVEEETDGITAVGVVGSIDIRPSFIERLNTMGDDVIEWHAMLQEHLTSYRKVKSRYSARCDSYRMGRDLLAKMAIGGKTLKLYLAVDPEDAALDDGKYHQRDLSETSAYQEVPFMLPIRSYLAVRKACRVIDYMMENLSIPKRRPRRKRIQPQEEQ